MSKKLVAQSKNAILPPLANLPPPLIMLRRKSWLRSSCATKAMQALLAVPAAVSIGVTLARPAHATGTVINTNKTSTVVLSNTVNYPGGNPFSLTAGHTITASGNGVYGNNAHIWTLSNAGTIISTGSYGVDLVGGSITNKTLSSIYGEIGGAIITGNTIAFVTNAINGTISGGTFGVELNSSQATLKNSGKIFGTNLTDSTGAFLENGGYVINHSTSTISGFLYGIEIAGGAGTLQNNGSIDANGIGVLLSGEPGSIDNIGFITQTGSNSDDAAIKMDGGYLHNGATSLYTLTPNPVISGFANGVVGYGTNALSINNSSTITGTGGDYGEDQYRSANGIVLGAGGGAITNNTGALIAGETGHGILSNYGSFSVVNDGTIFGSRYGIDSYIPYDSTISQTGNVSVANSNLIEGVESGVYVSTGQASISNSGGIIGDEYEGIYLASGGSITNGISTNGANAVIAGGYNGIYAKNTLVGVTNYGTITGDQGSGIQLKAGGTVANLGWYEPEVDGGLGTISGKYDGVYIGGGTGSVLNNGIIAGSINNGVELHNGGLVENSGLITGSYAGVYTGYAFNTLNNAGSVFNEGTIIGGTFAGVAMFSGGTVENDGLIKNTGTFGYGVAMYGPNSSVTNWGAITTGRFGQGVRLNDGGSITNFGLIKSGLKGDGVYLYNGGSITNAGSAVIEGLYGIKAANTFAVAYNTGTIIGYKDGVNLLNGGAVANVIGDDDGPFGGTGNIYGKQKGINVAGTLGFIFNNGSIGGGSVGVDLTAGGLVYNGEPDFDEEVVGGTITGGTYGVRIGGDGSLAGVFNIGLISGGSIGVDLTAGGEVENVADGDVTGTISGGRNGVYAYGPTELYNAGLIQSTFASSNANGISFANGGIVSNSSSGIIQGYNSGITVNGSTGSVTNAGLIQSTGISENYGGVNLYAGGGISNAQTGLITSTGYGVYVNGGAGYIANAGSILGGKTGVYLGDGGYVSNSSTGTIGGGQFGVNTGTLASVSVVNSGSISGTSGYGVYLQGGGGVTNTSTGNISSQHVGVGITGASGYVLNSGTITGTNVDGVYLAAGGMVVNIGNDSYTGVIAGDEAGVLIGYAGNTATNAGSVNNSGLILGGTAGVALFGIGTAGSGMVSNSGTIIGEYEGGAGVYLADGGTVGNTGSIGGFFGIGAQDGYASVSNSGSIAGEYAVDLTNGGSITNLASGSIDGFIGVSLSNGTIDNLTNETGGQITGYIGVAIGGLPETAATAGTVTNAGFIYGYAAGIVLHDAGSISNSGAIVQGGTDNVFDSAVVLEQGGNVSNLNGGLIQGYENGIRIDGGNATVSNAQTASITGTFYGIDTGSNVGTFNIGNAGTITGANGDGIYTESTIASIANEQTGTISGGYGIESYSDQFSLDNAGLVSGDGKGVYADNNIFDTNNQQTGTITAGDVGIYSVSDTFWLDNAGSIYGGSEGVYAVSGSIANVINELGGAITSDEYGLWSYADQFSLDNKGYISGAGDVGVGTEGDNDSITNEQSGTISGYYGIEGYSDQFSLDNAGLVEATGEDGYGLYTETDDANVTNEQTGIITGVAYGVYDDSDQFSLDNKGLISSSTYGVYLEYGGSVTNTGTIIGGNIGLQVDSVGSGVAIDNAGTIIGSTGTGVVLQTGTLTNEAGGVIQGGYDGIVASNGAAITNAGLIADSDGAGHAGVVLNGTSTSLINLATGTISGYTGIILNSSDETLVNSGIITGTGGTAILVAQNTDPAQITLTGGSALSGNIDGGGTDGQITLTGTNVIGNNIVNFGAGSALTVTPGADWTAAGNWTIETATNNGVFQGGVLGTPLNLTGNFVQGSLGTLRVVVTPTVTSHFLVSGSAVLGGKLTYVFAPGYYKPTTLDFLQAAGGVTVNNLTINYVGGVPSYLSKTTNNGVIITSGTLGSNLVLGYVAPLDDSIFSDVNQEAAGGAQAVNDSLLDKAAQGAGASSNSAACAAEAGATPANTTPGVSTAGRMATALGNAFCGVGGWIQATGTESSMDSSGGAPGFNAQSAGFLAGIDKPVGNAGTRLGLAVGYDETWLHDNEAGKGNADTTRVGLFGSQPIGRFTLAADFMYGYASNNTTRQTGIGGLGANYSSNIFSGGLQGDTTVALHGFTLNPAAGLRFASVGTGSFTETSGPELAPFAVSGASSGYTSIQPYLNVGVSRSFLTGSAISITPQALVGYTAEVGNRGKAVNLTVQDGTVFASTHSTPDAGAAELSAGVAAGKNNWSLFAKYTAYVSGNWTAQTGEAGLQIKF